MEIIKKITLFTAFMAIIAALSAFPAERVYADDYYISDGNIIIDCSTGIQKVNGQEDTSPVIKGSTSSNKVEMITAQGCTAKVKLSSADIDLSSGNDAAISITDDGDAVIELVGTNILKSGKYHAGIEKNNSGHLRYAASEF